VNHGLRKNDRIAGGEAVFMNGFEPTRRFFGGNLACGYITHKKSQLILWLVLA
jgi:hypothetical protein